MANSIPYDHPSLALGNLVPPSLLPPLEKIRAAQAKTSAAFERMNSLIAMRRGLSMTVNEMQALGVDITDLEAKIEELNVEVGKSASDYIAIRLDNDAEVQRQRETISELDVGAVVESPLKLRKESILQLPLAFESLQMDVQYFSYSGNSREVQSRIEQLVRDKTRDLGTKSAEIGKAAGAQVNQQRSNHNLMGTLVITASATHPNSAIIDPVELDVDKSVAAWNSVYGNSDVVLNPTDPLDMLRVATRPRGGADEKSLMLLTGANYGSCFVGMVHLVRKEITSAGLTNAEIDALSERMRMACWMNGIAGGAGADETLLKDVRRVLSLHRIDAHANIIMQGASVELKSSALTQGVKQVIESTPAPRLKGIRQSRGPKEIIENSRDDQGRLDDMGAQTRQLLKSLGALDGAANNVIDINTLMTAFDNYLAQVKTAKAGGMPVSFYFKRLTAPEIAASWIESRRQLADAKSEQGASSNKPSKDKK